MGRSDLQGTPWHYEYLKNNKFKRNSKNCVYNTGERCSCTISVNYRKTCVGEHGCEEFERSSYKQPRQQKQNNNPINKMPKKQTKDSNITQQSRCKKHSKDKLDFSMINRDFVKSYKEDPENVRVYVPVGMYDAFMKRILYGKRGSYIELVKRFLCRVGIEYTGNGQPITRFSEELMSKILKVSGKYNFENDYIITISKKEFDKIFLLAFKEYIINY